LKLSVIIVSYNCKVYLDYCIQSVISALKNFHGEVIVIDNNSTDNTKDFIRSKGYNIKFIESKINLGFSKANNQAVKLAKGEYLFFLNPDTVIPENLFDPFFKGENNLNNMGI
jgi:GT2 family glycosyltransferase